MKRCHMVIGHRKCGLRVFRDGLCSQHYWWKHARAAA